MTLTFGALSINDVLAAMAMLLFHEVVTKAFYEAETKSMRLWLANTFKAGLVASMVADAIKLGG